MNRAFVPAWLLLLIPMALPAAAQVRDAAPVASATGTGTIVGTVVEDGEPARPVRRAVVTLNSSDPLMGRTAITDDAGRVVFASLPAARYTLAATKRGWVPSAYGAKAIGRPGRSLLLTAGARGTATIRMARGAVISGTILDQFGQPVGGASLRVMKFAYSSNTGDRRLTPAGGMTSGPDERGAYRISGLAPGEYYIAAVASASVFSAGHDLHLTSDVDVEEALKSAQAGPAAPIVDVPQPSVGFSQVFYPGATSIAQATPIAVRVGEERTGVDVTIQYSPVARVEGTILSPSGEPAAARVFLMVNDPNGIAIGIQSLRSAEAGADGHFTLADIAAGPYVLSANRSQPGPTPERPQITAGTIDLDVQSERVSGITLTLQDALIVSGTIAYDGAGPPPSFAAMRVSLTPVQSTPGVTVGTGTNTTTADGRFTITGAMPGRYRLVVNLPPQSKWAIRSATLLGQDSLDLPFDLRQSVTDGAITLTDRTSELSGKVEPGSGGSTDYTMILFSTNRAHWTPQSRRILNARTSSDGSFLFRTVPPGEYYLATADDVEPGEWYDPAFLQRLLPAALRVTIEDGEKKVQDIRPGGG